MESKKNQLKTLNLQYQRAKQARDIHTAQMVEKYGSKLWFMYKHFGKEIPESFDEDLQLRKNYNYEVDIIKKQIEKLKQEIQRENSTQAYRQKQNEDNSLFSAAIEEYGVTNDFSVCGYILPDGQMLCFGSSGIRDTDHRNIKSVYKEVGIVVNGDNTDYLIDFMQRGAIRFIPECTGFNMCIEPTNEQYACIKDICRSVGGEVMVDFDDNNGKTVHGVQYNSVNPQRLVADIYRYFNEGIKPFGDTNESKIRSGRILKESVDMSMVGQVNYSWDFDEDEYHDWLMEDMEGENPSDGNLKQYIEDNVTFDIEYLDNDTFHYFDGDNLMYYQLEDEFGEKMANKILQDCLQNGEGSFETYELYEDDIVDINNPESLNTAAVKLLQHGSYYKDCRGFILSNGEVVYTPVEHNQCSIINGVNGTFDFIRLGNIRVLQQSIDLSKPPTPEQSRVLRQVINAYSDDVLYVDIITDNGQTGTSYVRPTISRVMGEIARYFNDGIQLQGSKMYEEFALLADKKLIKESNEPIEVTSCWGCPDTVYYKTNQSDEVRELDYPECGYVFGIWDGVLICGNDNDDTATMMHDDLIMYHIINHGWDDIIPAKYVNDNAFDWETLRDTQVDYYDDDEYPSYHDEETGEVLPEYKTTYGDLISSLGDPYARGRILHDFSKGLNFISFWDEPTKEEVKLIIKEYGNMALNAYWVNFNKENEADKYYKEYKVYTTKDWLNNNVEIPRIKKDEELYNIHTLPSTKKRETSQLKGVLSDKEAKQAKKLGNMTKAQYHSLIYQENREPVWLIISESQYERLFKKNQSKTITITEEQYKRLFEN